MSNRSVRNKLITLVATPSREELYTLVSFNIISVVHWDVRVEVAIRVGNVLDNQLAETVRGVALNSEACDVVETMI